MSRKLLWGFLGLALFVLACSKPIEIGMECTNNAPRLGEQNNRTADEAVLKSLYDELTILSQSNHCSGDKTWRITPYGAKACGGPIGYMPYRTDIDTTCFLQKVYHYTQQQQLFNTRYSIGSDCSVPPAPKSVRCTNGKAELVY